jgi:hypothetical protein
MENSKLWADPPEECPPPVVTPPPPATPPPVVDPQASASWGVGYAAQAAKVAAWKNSAKRNWTKGNADMLHGLMMKLHGNTVRSRPLIINHLMTPAGAPKVGVQESSAPEQYAPDGQTLNVMTVQWRNGYKANIAGATAVNYTPVVGDVGKRLTVAMTPSTAARAGIAFESNTTAKVIA